MPPPQTYRLAQVLGTGAYVGRLCFDILTDATIADLRVSSSKP